MYNIQGRSGSSLVAEVVIAKFAIYLSLILPSHLSGLLQTAASYILILVLYATADNMTNFRK